MSEVLDRFDFDDRLKLQSILDKEELSFLSNYIDDLENENNSLREQNSSLEDAANDWENQYREVAEFNPFIDFMDELDKERYVYTDCKYKTLEQLFDALDRVRDEFGEL